MTLYKRIQAQANRLLHKYIAAGLYPRASGQCVDCGQTKHNLLCHDHRDYSDALATEVVCYSCNGLRGKGKAEVFDPETFSWVAV